MQKSKSKSKKISDSAEVEPKKRVDLMVRDAIESRGHLDVSGVDVRLDPEREDMTVLAQGRVHVYGYTPIDRNFKRYQGTFRLVGFRSSHTPLGLDPLYLSYDLDTEIYPGSGS